MTIAQDINVSYDYVIYTVKHGNFAQSSEVRQYNKGV
jgi:hypothetical protein